MSLPRIRRMRPQGCHIQIGTRRSFNGNNNYCNHYSYAVLSNDFRRKIHDHFHRVEVDEGPSFKRRKFLNSSWEGNGEHYLHNRVQQLTVVSNSPSTSNCYCPDFLLANTELPKSLTYEPEHTKSECEMVFMSKDEIQRCSPSRKDGIDWLHETKLRYSYCAFLRNLGMRLELPQTTVGSAMVLCHRFFVRRSHAAHDRFLIATAALFLAAKSEETPRPLNTVLKLSYEIRHKQDLAFFPYLLPGDWFEQYREHVLEAEHMVLTTLNFELSVQHPFTPLASVLKKLGLSQTALVNLAWNLVSEGLRSSLWLQFEPHHIAAGAALLAAQFLNLDPSSYRTMWLEFQTTPTVLQDVVQQLMELL